MIEKIKERAKGKTLILCVGNEIKGDDGVGPIIAKSIIGKTNVEIINCEEVPESYTGKIKDAKPNTIIIIDAVEMKANPGDISIIEKEALSDFKLYTTHNVPFKVFVDYLYSETNADIFVIGIQPESTSFGKGLSEKVKISADYLTNIFINLFGE